MSTSYTTTRVLGSRNAAAKLDEHDVWLIRRLAESGLKAPAIAEKFEVQRQTVGRILRRETWTHVA